MTRPTSQPVITNAPVTQWEVKKVEGKTDVYLLSVSGYSSTFIDDGIITAINHEDEPQEWYITYQVAQDAYLIEAQPGSGWSTVILTEGNGTPIKLNTILAAPTYPPRYFPIQLFRFEFSG